jgi:hypothetical protein
VRNTKRPLVEVFFIVHAKAIILPRQARDKHKHSNG